MKGTLISILVGALAGALLTLASSVHASHVAASRAASNGSGIVAPAPAAPNPELRSAEPLPAPDDQAPAAK